ncbi:sugar kinase [Rossellomorea vietnamensis]|uniref:sugar kinase n=1 Tax=Rossellomorea vietnamensis TaxID=218284 RepID=UPI0022701B0F|nr:sugar kinase [Rossellomorea vietnamensis]MCC5801775.1 sugar kinase [Rossellomorea vietnamensis]
MDILTIGEPLMEFSETKDSSTGYLSGFGGDTSNFAVAAARQGAKVRYFTRVGNDRFGDQLLDMWSTEGIDVSFVTQDSKASTGIYFITYSSEGHQFAYYRKSSAASLLKPQDITEESFVNISLLHITGISQAISDSCCDAVFRAIEMARTNNILVSYDANLRLKLWPLEHARAVIHATAPLADIFLPSLEDAQQLTGLSDPNKIVDYYRHLGVKQMILKLGKRGVMVATSEERQIADGFNVDTVDTTGAGDTFNGAFCSQYIDGVSLIESAKYANAAAALSTTGYGAISPIPFKEDVQRFLAQSVV